MYGFKPKRPAQHLADGGFVATAKRMIGMKPDDPAQAAALAEYKANAAREKAAAKAGPAPAPAPQAAISQYTGMSAMQRREKEQGLADGGLVAKMKSADAGAAPFGSRGLNQLRDMPAKMQAMGFGPAKAEAPAPAPVTDPRAAKLQAMIPQMEAMGFKQAQAAADGGMIRGPGDGTSDSIPDEMEPGTFIMPADSTQTLGLDDEQAEGEKVPVRVSNGEFELPPERVQAVGAAVLEAIKGMTHTPTGQAGEGERMAQGFKPKGEQPQQFFADGGSVLDPQKRANSFGDAAAMTTDSAAKPIQSAPAAPASANVTRGAAFGVFNRQETAGTRGGMMQPIAATGPKTFEPAKSVYGAETRMNSTTDPRSLTYGGSGATAAAPYRGVGPNPDASNAAQTPALASVSAPAAQPAPPLAPVVATSPGAGRGAITPPAVQPSPAEMQTAPPRNGGQVSAQNMAAADSLAPSSPSTSATPTPAGFPGAPGYQGVTAPTVRNSTNDWAARKALENAATAASSITANGGAWDKSGPGDSQAQAAYKAALATDQTLQNAQPGLDAEAMRQNASLQRETIQQQGSTARDAERNAISRDELGMKREAQGFQTRAQAQQEQLRGVLTDPNTTPQQRAQAQQALQALTGKGDSWKAVALQGGTDAQGNKTESLLGAVNERTGEMKRMEGQGGAPTPPANHINALRANPGQSAQFDEIYGKGAAARVLGVG